MKKVDREHALSITDTYLFNIAGLFNKFVNEHFHKIVLWKIANNKKVLYLVIALIIFTDFVEASAKSGALR